MNLWTAPQISDILLVWFKIIEGFEFHLNQYDIGD